MATDKDSKKSKYQLFGIEKQKQKQLLTGVSHEIFDLYIFEFGFDFAMCVAHCGVFCIDFLSIWLRVMMHAAKYLKKSKFKRVPTYCTACT